MTDPRTQRTSERLRFGLPELDDAILGGGLKPGTLTVIAGATGIGKTHLGLAWADHGRHQEGHPGLIVDLTSRGDDQNHADYARDLFGWELTDAPLDPQPVEAIWDRPDPWPARLCPLAGTGRRVTRPDLDEDRWAEWRADLTRRLNASVAFLYGGFVRGARRAVFDGVEPVERFADSVQFELFEYLYEKLLKRDWDHAAREHFRQHFRANAARAEQHAYSADRLGTLYLYTTPEVMLDDLIARPIGSGDIFSNANTVIYLGKTRSATGTMGRALHVAKHRGSACSEEIRPYRITDRGIVLEALDAS